MMIEFRKAAIPVESQAPIKVIYENEVVGEHSADIVVDNNIIVELKAANKLVPDHHAQLLNYLKATDLQLCLLINFGTQKVQIKRIIN